MYDIQDDRGVPISKGVPTLVQVTAIIGIVVVFAILGMVIGAAAFGHAWPSFTSTKIPL
ncbi:MAG: hypothetical protein ABI346_06250 [Candidatus Baltobacteraceae bacterium]